MAPWLLTSYFYVAPRLEVSPGGPRTVRDLLGTEGTCRGVPRPAVVTVVKSFACHWGLPWGVGLQKTLPTVSSR